jgi:pimeloyl-ACP methyl ester carboxylesterase
VQWRHLFECPDVTDHFHLVAYDLPYHGKSVPPVGEEWWADAYELTNSHARAVPLALATALGLDCPVFMGCSVGGLLALDLARHHPEAFRAVISLEGSLRIPGAAGPMPWLGHPKISDTTKARVMEGMMSPSSPTAYRKETAFAYAAGWPPAFGGDLHYYFDDHDLTGDTATIDTSSVAVHILSGEYDHNAPPSHGRAAHDAISGSTFTEMTGLGHFPMSEDPERFLTFLLPVLRSIREAGA